MKKIINSLAVLLLSSSALTANAMSAAEKIDSLAQGCFAIKSPTTGKYVKQFHIGGIENGGQTYGFRTANINEADSFYFKPTRLKHFMITSQNGRYLSSRLPADMTAGTGPGKFSEWRVDASVWGSGFRFRFQNMGLNRRLRHNYSTNDFYYFDLLNPNENTTEHEYWLVPRNNCTEYPEMEVNVAGNPDALKGDANQPVRGFIDAHAHVASYEFMGGDFVHGSPWHQYGVTQALRDSKEIHGNYGTFDLLGNIFAYDDPNFRYDTRGWPEFPHWPTHRDVSHTGYYYKWIERAWLGGLRMMTSHMVENKVLCTAQRTINPEAWLSPNSCEAMDSVRLQVQRHKEMQDYIDAQAGGAGKGFFRLVYSPAEARQVIADGKLAVFMGMEVSELFDCGNQASGCSRQSIEDQLQEFHALGIRGLFPTHRFDNKIGGSEIEGGFINAGQWLSAGYLFDTKECDADTAGVAIAPGFPLVGSIPVLGAIFNGISNAPNYSQEHRHCNNQGLSELGVYLVNRMIDMGMLIELDHTGEETASSIMDIVEARNYSGVISAHSHLGRAPDGGLHNNFKRLVQAGGFVSPFNQSSHDLAEDIDMFLDEVETTQFEQGVGIGTDMTGLANQAGPRADAATDPLQYPFTSEFGLVFDKQKSGNRIMDFNEEGMAHYGMLADHLQDIREQETPRVYNALMSSAEAYIQMWERATVNNASAYFNPLEQEVKIVTQLNGDCLGIAGGDADVVEGVAVTHAPCRSKPRQADQHWLYNPAEGTFRNAANPALCMDSRDPTGPRLRSCENSDNSKWSYSNYTLRSPANPGVLDAVERTGKTIFHGHHGRDNQDWELRTERESYNWVTLRPLNRDGCIDVQNENTAWGTKLRFERCDPIDGQLFAYDPVEGTLVSKLDPNMCVDIPAGDTTNGTRLQIWGCNGTINQKWDFDGGAIRARKDRGKVFDVTGNGNIVIYSTHGGGNQRFKTILQ